MTKDKEPQANDLDSEAGFIETPEVANRLHISRGTVNNRRKSGELPYVKLGRRVLFHWPTIEQNLLRQQRGAQ